MSERSRLNNALAATLSGVTSTETNIPWPRDLTGLVAGYADPIQKGWETCNGCQKQNMSIYRNQLRCCVTCGQKYCPACGSAESVCHKCSGLCLKPDISTEHVATLREETGIRTPEMADGTRCHGGCPLTVTYEPTELKLCSNSGCTPGNWAASYCSDCCGALPAYSGRTFCLTCKFCVMMGLSDDGDGLKLTGKNDLNSFEVKKEAAVGEKRERDDDGDGDKDEPPAKRAKTA